jgi:hypothetical protein
MDAGKGAWPGWLREVENALAFHPQFIIAGNIRDLHPVPTVDGPVHMQTLEALWALLEPRGYEYLLGYDPVDRLQAIRPRNAASWPQVPAFETLKSPRGGNVAVAELVASLRSVQAPAPAAPAGAFAIDYASRIAAPLTGPGEEVDELFRACLKMSHQAQPRGAPGSRPPPYNPVFWLADQVSDLPDWFRVGNEAVRTIVIGLPDRAERQQIAARAAPGFFDYPELAADAREQLIRQFVLLTEGFTLRAMYAVQELARTQRFGLARIADAVRAYKVGSTDDPWKDPTVRDSIRGGEERIAQQVRGQPQAIRQTMDILKRSVTGLAGAHVGRSGSRPRGVLFFAGPTGVGKTELAKQVTAILFGDPSAYQRFDMSEFSAEHSEARLVGAPPGYIGHDAGGELVNAVRRRPFSVLLFDEVEKAHPRILDKFLQILEDGRLTDGRGDTVFFSEAVVIFTSNLGIYGEEEQGGRTVRVQKVSPETAPRHADVEAVVRPEIERHFRFVLQRPELLNRIGDNIVVFDFIREAVALQILRKMLANVVQRVSEEQQLSLSLGEEALATLEREAVRAAGSYGGRGVGNRLETCLVNPLARAIFDGEALAPGSRLTIRALRETDGAWEVDLA